MKKVLAVLAVAALALPVFAVVDYFPVAQNGNFEYNGASYGYGSSNGAQNGTARWSCYKQDMGWMSWVKNDGTKSVGDTSGLDLAAFVAANGGWSNVQVNLRFRTDKLLPTTTSNGGTAAKPNGAFIESIRAGNTGPIRQDTSLLSAQSSGGGLTASGFTGNSSSVAFRGGDTHPDFASGGFYLNGEFYTTAGQGEAWKTPSTWTAGFRTFNPGSNLTWGPDAMGLLSGLNPGKDSFALPTLLGLYDNNGTSTKTDTSDVTSAGQILAKSSGGSPLVVNQSNFPAVDANPRAGIASGAGFWYSVPLDQAFAQDLATNPENKGLVFNQAFTALFVRNSGADSANQAFYTLEKESANTLKQYAPYLEVSVVPEPATLCLLALGGLALLRRKA